MHEGKGPINEACMYYIYMHVFLIMRIPPPTIMPVALINVIALLICVGFVVTESGEVFHALII